MFKNEEDQRKYTGLTTIERANTSTQLTDVIYFEKCLCFVFYILKKNDFAND